MKLPSLSFLAQAFVDTCARFPATMLCAFVGTASVMAAVENDGGNNYIKLWIMAQLGLALCTGLAVWAESGGWNRLRALGIQLTGLAYLSAYYFVFDMDGRAMESVDLPRYFALLIAAHLFVAVAPYLNGRPVADFWEYNKQLFANFVVGVHGAQRAGGLRTRGRGLRPWPPAPGRWLRRQDSSDGDVMSPQGIQGRR